jgi:LuxR family maltose regulon positive regulatory protein
VVQVAVARHDLDAAAAHLARWRPGPSDPGAQRERELWAAILAAEAGDRRAARQRAGRLVAGAEAEGHVRLFLDAGRPAEQLLRDLHHASPSPYLRRLLEAASLPRQAAAAPGHPGLSDRELEVVRYLPTTLSNTEIAARLYVSVNTLKTHLRAIYRKLGVTTRQAAIRRAEEEGLA